MRLVLLLIVVAIVGVVATRALKTHAPAAAQQEAAGAASGAPASRETLRQFGQDVNKTVLDGAADRARRTDEATRQ